MSIGKIGSAFQRRLASTLTVYYKRRCFYNRTAPQEFDPMAKHNQSKTLGTLTDFQTAPPPAQETADERFVRLEHRLSQVETLLNDVMQQLDKPYRDQPHSNGKPKQAKPKQAKPKQAKPKQRSHQPPKRKRHRKHPHRHQPKPKSKRTSKPLYHSYISTPIAYGNRHSCKKLSKHTAT